MESTMIGSKPLVVCIASLPLATTGSTRAQSPIRLAGLKQAVEASADETYWKLLGSFSFWAIAPAASFGGSNYGCIVAGGFS